MKGTAPRRVLTPAPVGSVSLQGGLFRRIADDMRGKVIPYQWEALNDRVEDAAPSHCMENFRIAAGLAEGEFFGCVFQDSDLAKWIEAVAYSLKTHPDAELEKTADEAIDIIGLAQQPDGYLNTYFTVKEPDKRWQNLRDWHELYCAGHMMEAAVAYFEATGKRKLLDIMLRMAANIGTVLGPEPEKLHGYPGHPEIELALVRMYRATGDSSLLELAKYFVDERGTEPNFIAKEHPGDTRYNTAYCQSHKPVREQETVEGHSVRALYLLAGMADVAAETGDAGLLEACETLFENVTTKRMYVTGGVGSTHHGEAFSYDYGLPNDTVYAETCASIALVFFAHRMLQIRPDAKYADVLERALYNTCIAGMSLDGRNFFYVNPLQVSPEASKKDPGKRHVLPVRPKWFGCACCPPNLARLVTSLGQYVYSTDERGVYVHLYMDSDADLMSGDVGISIQQRTEYPWDGRVAMALSTGQYALRLRLPDWCKAYTLTVAEETFDAPVQDGYLAIDRTWTDGDEVVFTMDMPARRVYASPSVTEDIGRVAVMRGPLVYCAEEADNGKGLMAVRLPRDAALMATRRPDMLGGITVVTAQALTCTETGGALYRDTPVTYDQPINLTLIPYYAWANRGAGEMTVWLRDA